jgi:hypothetical protein
MNSNNWINVNKSEPPTTEKILVYGSSNCCEEGVYFATYDTRWEEVTYGSRLEFKYWMPLPDIPEDSSDTYNSESF